MRIILVQLRKATYADEQPLEISGHNCRYLASLTVVAGLEAVSLLIDAKTVQSFPTIASAPYVTRRHRLTDGL